MTQPLTALSGAALILCLSACGNTTSSQEAGAGNSVRSDVEAVKRIENAFLTGWEAKDPAIKSLYAEDAVLVMTDAPPRRGVPAISEAFEQFARNRNETFKASNTVTVLSEGGDLAYSHGTYVISRSKAAAGQPLKSNGYYLVVYKKQPDGAWKVVQDVSSRLP